MSLLLKIRYLFTLLLLLSISTGVFAMKPVNFKEMKLPDSPNKFLVCPHDYCNDTANVVSKTYDVSVGQLKKDWEGVIKKQVRVKHLETSADKMQDQYVQRSRIFRFPDYVDVRFIPLDENKSTIAIYSRSKFGHSDLGVNKARIEKWLKELNELITKSS